MKRIIISAVVNALAFAAFPVLIGLTYLADQAYTVVQDFRIITQVLTPEGVLIEGTMDKRRDCRFVEIIAMLDEVPSAVVFLDTREDRTYSRAMGPQKWGPWLVIADARQGVKLHARHRCHAGWEHTETLTSFVAGVQ